MAWVDRQRETVELTLRVCAAYGGLATAATLLGLSAGVALTPALFGLLGIIAGIAATSGRALPSAERGLAAGVLGGLAIAVALSELGSAWANASGADAARLLISPLVAGALVAVAAHAGMRLTARGSRDAATASRILAPCPSPTSSPQ